MEIRNFLLENGYDDIVINERKYPKNNKVNAENWIYLSDVIKHYVSERQSTTEVKNEENSEQLSIANVKLSCFYEVWNKWCNVSSFKEFNDWLFDKQA